MKLNINKKTKHLVMYLILTIMLFGCTEVIDVDLNSADPKIVIEGAVFNNKEESFVKITKTTDYFNPNVYPTVSDAVVQISDSKGNQFTLFEVSSGYYETTEINPEVGVTYYLNVLAEGEIYTATSIMKERLEIDSTWYVKDEDNGDITYDVYCTFKDNGGLKDYARSKSYINGRYKFTDASTYDDELTDGKLIEFYSTFEDSVINAGDIVTSEIIAFDKYAYDYFKTFDQIVNTSEGNIFGVAASDNPISNISNNALGFFGVYNVENIQLKIEE